MTTKIPPLVPPLPVKSRFALDLPANASMHAYGQVMDAFVSNRKGQKLAKRSSPEIFGGLYVKLA